jgi:hypothetical protein|tara:strand:+ start:341 stop:484 length:144 start_codon:yes stop_codon:yes gene_type:complete
MTINELIREFKHHFKDFEYKATSNKGQVFKSKGFDEADKKINKPLTR